MDLSKLPRMSQTPATPESPAADAAPPPPPAVASTATTFCLHCGAPLRPGARFCDSCGVQAPGAAAVPTQDFSPGVGAEVWISVAIGALLLLMQPRLIQFLSHKLFGTFFSPYLDNQTGAEVPYTSQLDFWSDLGITLFALVLILEGVAIALARRRGVILAAFPLTVLTTAYNLGYLVITFSSGVALLSAFAVAFGVYIAIYEWNLLRSARGA